MEVAAFSAPRPVQHHMAPVHHQDAVPYSTA